MGDNEKERRGPEVLALKTIGLCMIAGVVVVLVFSLAAGSIRQFLLTASTGVLVSAASTLIGCLLGFLFGIPRKLQGSGEESRDENDESEAGGKERVRYQANTNLEQISDWLTKILVGVGLTQISTFDDKLSALANFIAPGLQLMPEPHVMAISIMLYFSLAGFLFSYLWTRLYLAKALQRADSASTEERIKKLESQPEKDVAALNLVSDHFASTPGAKEIPFEQLKKTIAAASMSARQTIFNNAWSTRSKNWRDRETKPVMARTIPVFRALIEAGGQNFHRNHAQLSYALKDKLEPDWAGALQEIDRAIDLRGSWQENGYLFYEMNRALCRIALDPAKDTDNASEPELVDDIMKDLTDASYAPEVRRILSNEPIVKEWLERNRKKLPRP